MRRVILTVLLMLASTEAYAASPLDQIRVAVAREKRAGRMPVIVFNIDGTIFDNRPRSQAILRDFIAAGGDSYSDIADSINSLGKDSIDYFVVDSFKTVGVTDMLFLESALKFWSDRFFTDEYVQKDMPMDGSASFITEMHDSGAMIVYLSGRGRTAMMDGTFTSLRMHGFPVATPRTILILKPNPRDNNEDYKRGAMRDISRLGRVVAAFENDPRSVNLMKRQWPSAKVVMIRAPHAKDAPPVEKNIPIIDSYID